MAAARRVAEGLDAHMRVHVRTLYPEAGLASVWIATPGSAGGRGFEQRTVPLETLEPLPEETDPRR